MCILQSTVQCAKVCKSVLECWWLDKSGWGRNDGSSWVGEPARGKYKQRNDDDDDDDDDGDDDGEEDHFIDDVLFCTIRWHFYTLVKDMKFVNAKFS